MDKVTDVNEDRQSVSNLIKQFSKKPQTFNKPIVATKPIAKHITNNSQTFSSTTTSTRETIFKNHVQTSNYNVGHATNTFSRQFQSLSNGEQTEYGNDHKENRFPINNDGFNNCDISTPAVELCPISNSRSINQSKDLHFDQSPLLTSYNSHTQRRVISNLESSSSTCHVTKSNSTLYSTHSSSSNLCTNSSNHSKNTSLHNHQSLNSEIDNQFHNMQSRMLLPSKSNFFEDCDREWDLLVDQHQKFVHSSMEQMKNMRNNLSFD